MNTDTYLLLWTTEYGSLKAVSFQIQQFIWKAERKDNLLWTICNSYFCMENDEKNVHYPTCEILYWKKIITLNMEQELRTKMLTIIIYLLEKNWKPPPLESFVHLSHVFLCPLLFCFELDKAGDGKWCFLFYSKMF